MTKSKSSRRWLERHMHDSYVQQALQDGYRSRAAYKLMEIDDRDHVLHCGATVVDLGAAPGGWSQVAVQRVGRSGRVIAIDILNMEPLPGVELMHGDFTEPCFMELVEKKLVDCDVDLVISDLAPNLTGQRAIDQPRAIALGELVLEFSCTVLRPGGVLLLKAFHGSGYDELLRSVRRVFGKTVVRKPKASRRSSREVYVLALNHQL